jgi:hypothetical protein
LLNRERTLVRKGKFSVSSDSEGGRERGRERERARERGSEREAGDVESSSCTHCFQHGTEWGAPSYSLSVVGTVGKLKGQDELRFSRRRVRERGRERGRQRGWR